MSSSGPTPESGDRSSPPVSRLSTRLAQVLVLRERAIACLEQRTRVWRVINSLVLVALALNIVLVLYAMTSVVVRQTLVGASLIDSTPVGFYILPLFIALPSVLLGYHRSRSGLFVVVILVLSVLVLSPLTVLVHGFVPFAVLSIVAIIVVVLTGRFRPKGSVRRLGVRGLSWLIVLNLLGLTFPVSIYVMGAVPIAQVSWQGDGQVYLSVPLSDFEYAFVDIAPSSGLVDELESAGFGVDLRVRPSDNVSWGRLETWLAAINSSAIPFVVTLDSERQSLVDVNPLHLGSDWLLEQIFDAHTDSVSRLGAVLSAVNIDRSRGSVRFDMCLSESEWSAFMSAARSVSLDGFGRLVRSSIERINATTIASHWAALVSLAHGIGMSCQALVESLVLDDLCDDDTLFMTICGVTADSLRSLDSVCVHSSRTRYSLHMLGDVGEYLAHSVSLSAGHGSPHVNSSGLVLGVAGAVTDLLGRPNPVYDTLEQLASDVLISLGNGAREVTVESLSSLRLSFGNNSLGSLKALLTPMVQQPVTYTFRIYALRAVMMAIDSFDVLLL
ncbi:MAG: hypothetical protein HXY34_00695 [Candidatus Thorarchaeota archaeon]|nr:hypothetical protein [Candidatus Thorarchaeota archaeon]